MKNKTLWKQVGAAAIAAAMVMSTVPATPVQAAGGKTLAVSSQKQLNQALKTVKGKNAVITVKAGKNVKITIPKGTYKVTIRVVGKKAAGAIRILYGGSVNPENVSVFIKEKNIDDNKGLLPESFETYQIIEPNDIVFRFTDLQNDKRSLRNAISKYHGIITSAYIGVKTKENADFYNYLFRAYDLQKVFYSMGDGMRQSLKMDELNKMPIVLPKIEAQERIVKFINEENQRINNLVVKQKNLIEKLKEYRASIISHAVTGKIDVREFGA